MTKRTVLSVSSITNAGTQLIFTAEIRSFNLKSMDLFCMQLKPNEKAATTSEYLFAELGGAMLEARDNHGLPLFPRAFGPGDKLMLQFDEMEAEG